MTPAERLRKHQRALERTQRELDRERTKLEAQEKKLIADIKKSAKNGQVGACKIQAKDLVRTRRYISKFYQMRTQLQAISLRIQTVRSNEQMAQSMRGATRLLGAMNRQMNLPSLQRIAMEFERENDIMDQREEMMNDAIDDATGVEDEEEGEEIVNEVLDEIGVDLGAAVCFSVPFKYGWRACARSSNTIFPTLRLTTSSLDQRRLGFRNRLHRKQEWLRQLGRAVEAAMLVVVVVVVELHPLVVIVGLVEVGIQQTMTLKLGCGI